MCDSDEDCIPYFEVQFCVLARTGRYRSVFFSKDGSTSLRGDSSSNSNGYKDNGENLSMTYCTCITSDFILILIVLVVIIMVF